MKKNLLYLLTALMVSITIFGLVSCSDDDDDNGGNSALVGTWVSTTQYEQISITFRSDGTGTEVYRDYESDYSDRESFTYSISGRYINFKFESGERYKYRYDLEEDDILWLEDEDGDEYIFYKR